MFKILGIDRLNQPVWKHCESCKQSNRVYAILLATARTALTLIT